MKIRSCQVKLFVTQALLGLLVIIGVILVFTPILVWIDGLILAGSCATLVTVLLAVGALIGKIII